MKKNNIFLSVIVPVFNEESRIDNIEKIIAYLKKQPYRSELIVVNDGSTDSTAKCIKKIAKKFPLHVISLIQNRGKGYAIKQGMLAAQGDWRLFLDIDLSTPLATLSKFLKHTKNAPVIIGSRRIKHAHIKTHQPFLRELMGRVFTKFSQIIVQSGITDFTCGFKSFRSDAAKKIFALSQIYRWGFDSEILFLAKKYQYPVTEVPVEWTNDPGSRVRFPHAIFQSFFEILQIRWNDMVGKYGEYNPDSASVISVHFLKNFGIPILIFSYVFAIAGYFSTLGVDIHHDGLLLKPALDILHGKNLFSQTFTMYGALTTLFQALILKVFGEYLLAIHLVTAGFYGLTAVVLYYVWKHVLSTLSAVCAIIIFPLVAAYLVDPFYPWSSVYALLLQALSLLLLVKFIQNNFTKIVYCFIIGALTALTFWTRQNVGVFLFLAVIGLFVVFGLAKEMPWRKVGICIANLLLGFVIVSAVFFYWLFVTHALYDWWLQSMQFGSVFLQQYGDSYSIAYVLKSLFALSIEKQISSYAFWRLIPIPILFFLFLSLYKTFRTNHNTKNNLLLTLAVLCAASWLQYYPLPENQHMYWAAIPSFGLYFYFLQSTKRYRVPSVIRVFIICILMGALGYLLAARLYRGYKKTVVVTETSQKISVLYGMKMTQIQKMYLESVYNTITSYTKSHPDKPFIVRSRDALYYTFTPKSENPHQAFIVFSGLTTAIYPTYEKDVDKYVQKKQPLILLDSEHTAPKNYTVIKSWPKYQVRIAAPRENR